MTRRLRIAVADDERNMREYLRELLPRMGHEVVAEVENGRQLVEQCRAAAPDLVITDISMLDLDGIAAAAEINRDKVVPVILVSAHHAPEVRARAMRDYILGYLVKPVKQADLEAAIDLAMLRAQEFQTLRNEAADLRQALEDRKLIERAKGIIVRRLSVDEHDAYRRLRRLSSERNKKVIESAREVMDADAVFAALDER